MTLTLSTAARNARLDALVDLLDAGSGAGKLRIYTGARPAGPGTAVGAQTLLAEFTLADPAFGASSNGVADLDADPDLSTTALATGTAAWFRALDSNNVAVFDGRVTATGGGGDLTMATTSVVSGVTVTATIGTLTESAGTAD